MLDEIQMKEIEANARIFAEINSAAHEVAPLLVQEFEATLKGSDAAYSAIEFNCGLMKGNTISLLGKTVKVTVDWSACGGIEKQSHMWIRFKFNGHDTNWALLTKEQMQAMFVQKGMITKMYDAWHFARYGE
ncbi:hypothetical protein VPHD530_0028 [Vibrio phage D530]